MSNTLNLEVFKAYEDGKHRRYTLLFSVNGGAFAIAKLLADKPELHGVIGKLHVRELAVGMIVFTILMFFDILFFGQKMRLAQKKLSEEKPAKEKLEEAKIDQQKQPARDEKNEDPLDIFSWLGKTVLSGIAVLLCAAWVLAAWHVEVPAASKGAPPVSGASQK